MQAALCVCLAALDPRAAACPCRAALGLRVLAARCRLLLDMALLVQMLLCVPAELLTQLEVVLGFLRVQARTALAARLLLTPG